MKDRMNLTTSTEEESTGIVMGTCMRGILRRVFLMVTESMPGEMGLFTTESGLSERKRVMGSSGSMMLKAIKESGQLEPKWVREPTSGKMETLTLEISQMIRKKARDAIDGKTEIRFQATGRTTNSTDKLNIV